MLQLKDIKKEYEVAGQKVHALKGISLTFRKSEFVSVLGPSGCGKTTLLNIIGGLDKYTSGDLIIEGVSTKKYGDRDWDTYRNHSIGFIFQSYHLIPHQTILQNVELALTIAGVDKKERRQRAIEALNTVGLSDKIHSRPNQLSGGQAQRVAIARALINDPEIVLADEPTGALDSVTSVQIMELLKDISKDRLVIMVTHNPELAVEYSTRIVRLKDGEIVDDSMPYTPEEEALERAPRTASENGETEHVAAAQEAATAQSPEDGEATTQSSEQTAEGSADAAVSQSVGVETHSQKKNKGKRKKSAMSRGMAMGLSLKNLLSKRRRTAMVSVAGSIGIIGVSMVLAISSGVHSYINDMENDMLSGYPITITQNTYDFSTLSSLNRDGRDLDVEMLRELKNGNRAYVTSLLKTLGTFSTGFMGTNQIDDAYLRYVEEMPAEYVNLVQYKYDFNVVNNIYTDFKVSENREAFDKHFTSPNTYDYEYNMSVAAIRSMYANILSRVEGYSSWGQMISSVKTFTEVPYNFDYVMSQYDVVCVDKDGEAVTEGYTRADLKKLFDDKGTLVLVMQDISKDDVSVGGVAEMTLAQYGYFTEDEFLNYAQKGVGTEGFEDVPLACDDGLPYTRLVGKDSKKFTYYPNDYVYTKQEIKAVPRYSDTEIRALSAEIDKVVGNDKVDGVHTAGELMAEYIITARHSPNGDQALKDLYNTPTLAFIKAFMTEEEFVDAYRIPADDETVDAFFANAYTSEYQILHQGSYITLPSFAAKAATVEAKPVELGVKLVLKKKDDVAYGCMEDGFYYTKALTDYILDVEGGPVGQPEKASEIVKFLADEDNNISEIPMYVNYFYVNENIEKEEGDITNYYLYSVKKCTIETNSNLMDDLIGAIVGWGSGAGSLNINANLFGGDRHPTGIYIYPKDFEMKDKVTEYLNVWNNACKDGGRVQYADGTYTDVLEEGQKISYSDTVGLIISMVNTMIEMITVALIAFTALSLVVSTVMIGIITYVSVVERVKEIGILRAVGARKKDIKHLFNAETFIIGFIAGLFGILVTYLLSIIVNVVVMSLAGFWGIAALPWWQAIIMIALSVGLTLISGLIPASAAAKKDPVVALRTE